jgi:DNA-binding NarL/FixJ family response regulator
MRDSRRGIHLRVLRVATVTPGGGELLARIKDALESDGVRAVQVDDGASALGGSHERWDAIVLVADDAPAQISADVGVLCERFPDVPLVAVATRVSRTDVRAVLQAGAMGVVELDRVEDCLALAVRSACVGLVTVPKRNRDAAAGPNLSVREKQILGMVVLGFTNAEIAHKLYVAESTVKSHLSSAFGKLGVRSRNEATAPILDQSSGLGTGILAITPDAVGASAVSP